MSLDAVHVRPCNVPYLLRLLCAQQLAQDLADESLVDDHALQQVLALVVPELQCDKDHA